MAELWLLFVLAAFLGCLIVALIFDALTADRRRFYQSDWVAESKRRVTHRGFKTRMGARN